ncbi:MAG: amidase [Gammaproteobacteria bacterium]|jgi:amidase|nr:amidase [Gammaproteobacteria bacterium]HJN94698.1 amidase [Gammaproteobacteria bacterium]|tara:strand:- start:15383 stop:16870 length:1488 start_codon:yes stop_codon:yes gene_type:complete
MDRRRFLEKAATVSAAYALPLTVSRGLFAAGMPADLVDLDAIGLSIAIKDKHTSCVEVMQAYLQHIHTYNPAYNAIISMVDDDELIDQAREADQALARGDYRGWMHGMPHAVKDLLPVAGLRHTDGSPMYANRIAENDSALVARLRGEGAIFIGKTNTPEFGLGSQSYNPVFGATGSAWNPELTSGGSSGGAASGLGTHMLPVADGSDMMGSLRNPGAFNNVIGFRPSVSVMSNNPTGPRALSTSGPMGRNTADTIRLLQTIAVQPVASDYSPMSLNNVKLGWMGNLDDYLAMEPGILNLCESSLSSISSAGATVEATRPGFTMSDLWFCWTTLRHSGRASMKSFYDNPETRAQLKPEVIWEIEQSQILTDSDRSNANLIRASWYSELERMFSQYDFLVLPTAQVFPYPKTTTWPREINGRSMDTYHRWMEVVILGSLGGLPVINVPVGFDAQGRPMGMQIMGNYGEDKRVLEFALAYEQITDHLQQRPKLVAAA